MKTKETIAIIGAADTVGSAIAKGLIHDQYRLVLMSGNAQKLNALTETLSAENKDADIDAGDCAREVCWESDIIVMAESKEDEAETAERIKEVATGKVVISVASSSEASATSLSASPETISGERLQRLLPHSKVVKAFCDRDSIRLGRQRADVFIASDDPTAIEVASKILTSAGFHAVVIRDRRPM